MTLTVNEESGLARTLYACNGYLSQVNYRVLEFFNRWDNPTTPGIFDNYSTKTAEYAYRYLFPVVVAAVALYGATKLSLRQIGVVVLGMVAFEALRQLLHIAAYYIQKKEYLYVRGGLPEREIKNPKVMTWNVLGLPTKPWEWGGCNPFRYRFAEIAKMIRAQQPDIVVLQECCFDASVTEAIIREFKGEYAHFYVHNGPTLLTEIQSGLIFMSKCPVKNFEFIPLPVLKPMKRGFGVLQLENVAIIGTHMEAENAPKAVARRREQLIAIHAYAIAKLKTPAVLAGDTNMNAKSQERDALNQVFVNVYDGETPTCTNELTSQRVKNNNVPPTEWVDQIATIKRTPDEKDIVTDLKVIPAYKYNNGVADTQTALSDHNALVATIRL